MYKRQVPDSVPNELAVGVNCAFSQVYYGLERAGLEAGETLVIQGAGGLGLYASAIAKEKGAKVIVIDGVKERLDLARRFGADHTIDTVSYTHLWTILRPTLRQALRALTEKTTARG